MPDEKDIQPLRNNEEIEALSYDERILLKDQEIWNKNSDAGLADMAVALDAKNITNRESKDIQLSWCAFLCAIQKNLLMSEGFQGMAMTQRYL